MHQVLNRHVAPNSTISPHKQYVAVLADCIHRLASRPQIARKLVCNVDRYPRISCLISRPKCIAAELVAVMCEVAVFWGIRMFTSCSVIPVSPLQSEAIRDLLTGRFSPITVSCVQGMPLPLHGYGFRRIANGVTPCLIPNSKFSAYDLRAAVMPFQIADDCTYSRRCV